MPKPRFRLIKFAQGAYDNPTVAGGYTWVIAHPDLPKRHAIYCTNDQYQGILTWSVNNENWAIFRPPSAFSLPEDFSEAKAIVEKMVMRMNGLEPLR